MINLKAVSLQLPCQLAFKNSHSTPVRIVLDRSMKINLKNDQGGENLNYNVMKGCSLTLNLTQFVLTLINAAFFIYR